MAQSLILHDIISLFSIICSTEIMSTLSRAVKAVSRACVETVSVLDITGCAVNTVTKRTSWSRHVINSVFCLLFRFTVQGALNVQTIKQRRRKSLPQDTSKLISI